ncbi:MAG: DUF5330 domain-containing protein [Pseudomonadota bacterium]
MGILRTAFWVSAVIILLPAGNDNTPGGGKPVEAAKVTAQEMVTAASSTAGDVSEFCSRQPGVCETGSAMLQLFEAKAKNGVRLIYHWASDANLVAPATAGASGNAGDLVAGSDLDHLIDEVSLKTANVNKPRGAGNTLKLEDVLPDWSDPKSRSNS